MQKIPTIVVAVVFALILSAAAAGTAVRDYQIVVMMPNATNLFEGGSVMRNGFEAGSIESIDVKDGMAKLVLDLDGDFGKLHEGATVEVIWKALLGERLVKVTDGPEGNAEIPSGAMLTGPMKEPVEIDQVLATLDEPTRKKINSLVQRVSTTLDGREKNINETLRTAGPALKALGGVLSDIGTDGEAINQLVTQLNNMLTILAKRDANIEQIVNQLGATTATMVKQQRALGDSVQQLPEVVDRARETLAKVPGAVDETVPLLEDLAPASKRLTSVAKNLKPLMTDLRPAIAQLRPTLSSLASLLRYTPSLMDSGSATFPAANSALRTLTPALDFLRPYTPEVAGWASNWGSANGGYDANGHYGRFFVQAGLESANINPGITGPGVTQTLTPAPGSPVGQPWVDAYGSGMQ